MCRALSTPSPLALEARRQRAAERADAVRLGARRATLPRAAGRSLPGSPLQAQRRSGAAGCALALPPPHARVRPWAASHQALLVACTMKASLEADFTKAHNAMLFA